MDEQLVNEVAGYGPWKESVIAWLLCSKREPLRSKIGKDVALVIAKLIPVDLSGNSRWKRGEYMVYICRVKKNFPK